MSMVVRPATIKSLLLAIRHTVVLIMAVVPSYVQRPCFNQDHSSDGQMFVSQDKSSERQKVS